MRPPLSLLNVLDLQKILEWNVEHGIHFFPSVLQRLSMGVRVPTARYA